MKKTLYLVWFLFSLVSCANESYLRVGFYKKDCPQAEEVVGEVVRQRFETNPTVTAALLRMHFHDCFVHGCDASLLIDSTANRSSEKAAGANRSVREFELIDRIKAQLESACPSTVSCADIIALATRDSVGLAGGPIYKVPTGRRDGLVSNDEDVNLPGPAISVTGAVDLFKKKGLTTVDAVALLGAHTVGQGNCGFFSDRIGDFQGTGRPDPSMDPAFVTSLRNICDKSPSAPLDQTTPAALDNNYFKLIRARRGVFELDQRLATDPLTKDIVARFATNNTLFVQQFADSILKMGSVEPLTGHTGEIRNNCRQFNKK